MRISEFQSSPSRRRRTDYNVENDPAQPIISGSIQNEKSNKENHRRIQLEKKRQRSRSSCNNETEK